MDLMRLKSFNLWVTDWYENGGICLLGEPFYSDPDLTDIWVDNEACSILTPGKISRHVMTLDYCVGKSSADCSPDRWRIASPATIRLPDPPFLITNDESLKLCMAGSVTMTDCHDIDQWHTDIALIHGPFFLGVASCRTNPLEIYVFSQLEIDQGTLYHALILKAKRQPTKINFIEIS